MRVEEMEEMLLGTGRGASIISRSLRLKMPFSPSFGPSALQGNHQEFNRVLFKVGTCSWRPHPQWT